MPVRPAVPNVIKHQIMVWVRERWCVTTLWVEHSGVPTQAMVDADRAVIKAWGTSHWRQVSEGSGFSSIRQLKAWSMHTSPPTPFVPETLYPLTHINGTGTVEGAPLSNCCAVSLRTGALGALPKPPNGRIYHPRAVSSEANGVDTMAASTRNAIVAAYEALRVAFTGVGNIGTWVIVSFWDGGTRAAPVLRPAPLVLPITRIQADQRIDQQRRRLPRQQAYVTN